MSTRDLTSTTLTTSESKDKRYIAYLIVIALLGWSMASYDSNLLTLTLPAIAKDLNLSSTRSGSLNSSSSAAKSSWPCSSGGARIASVGRTCG